MRPSSPQRVHLSVPRRLTFAVAAWVMACSLAGPADAQDPAGRRERATRLHRTGVALERAGNAGSAVGYYRDAIYVDPRYGPAYAALGELYLARGKLSDARESFEVGLSRAPGHAPLFVGLAATLERLGSGRDAAAVLRALTEQHPTWWQGHLARAKLAERLGAFAEALASYRAVLDILVSTPAGTDSTIADEVRPRIEALIVLVGGLDPVRGGRSACARSKVRAALARCPP